MINFSTVNKNHFEKIYEDMLFQFPQCELKTKKHFLEMLENPNYSFINCSVNKQNIGYFSYYKNDYLWLDYLAIYSNFHSKGWGTKILKQFFKENEDSNGCFFEIEKIDEKDKCTTKRQEFYKRLGCQRLNFKYFYPNDIEELEMDLFYFPLCNNQIPSNKQVFNQIEEIFQNIHFDVVTKEATLKKLRFINKSD